MRCKHDKNYVLGEQWAGISTFVCYDGRPKKDGEHGDAHPTGLITFKCLDCEREVECQIGGRHTPRYVQAAWDTLREAQHSD